MVYQMLSFHLRSFEGGLEYKNVMEFQYPNVGRYSDFCI